MIIFVSEHFLMHDFVQFELAMMKHHCDVKEFECRQNRKVFDKDACAMEWYEKYSKLTREFWSKLLDQTVEVNTEPPVPEITHTFVISPVSFETLGDYPYYLHTQEGC